MGEYYLMHSGRSKRDGAKVGSGRYPLGSGERPNQWKYDKTLESKQGSPNFYKEAKNDKRNNKNQDVSKAISTFSNSSKQAVDAAKKLEKKTRKKNPPMDLSQMSDDELRKKVNRANLERQYNDLYNNEENITKGRSHLIEVLDTAGDIIAIATPLAILAGEIWKAKH